MNPNPTTVTTPTDRQVVITRRFAAPRRLVWDAWTNPEGSQLTHLDGKKVYEFLKVPDKISVRFRNVGHITSNEDLLDFADHVFFDKALPKEFGKPAYKEEKKAFTWDVPK